MWFFIKYLQNYRNFIRLEKSPFGDFFIVIPTQKQVLRRFALSIIAAQFSYLAPLERLISLHLILLISLRSND